VWYGFGTYFCPCTGFVIVHQDVESEHTVLNYYYFVIDFVVEIHDTEIFAWRQKLRNYVLCLVFQVVGPCE
jgi:hypothetical protein